MSHKLPKAIRLDDSDTQIYDNVAIPGEWAIPGSFEFLNDSEQHLQGKRLQAFRSGFLGIRSGGWTTLVSISELSEAEYQKAIDTLAEYLLANHGAPDKKAAVYAAQQEIGHAESLCDQEIDTLLAIERTISEDEVSEVFKRFTPQESADWEQGKPLVLVAQKDC